MAAVEGDWFFSEYRKILEKGGEAVLKYILQCGTDGKFPTVPLDEYLKTLPPESTANYNQKIQQLLRNPGESPPLLTIHNSHFNKIFNKTEQDQIRGDPSCSNWDISLLYKTIYFVCEKVEKDLAKWKTTPSTEIESLAYEIKEKRNMCIHAKQPIIRNDKEFHNEVETVTKLFERTLEATKVRYNRDERELKVKKGEVLKVVEDTRREIQQRAASKSLPQFKAETNKELQKSLNNAKDLDPLYFLIGHRDKRVDVQSIFSRIDVIRKGDGGPFGEETSEQVDYLKLLTSLRKGPQILLIEGDAGSGKTTLITFILSEWLKEACDRRMEGLDHYDLLLRVVCREESIPTLDGLLKEVLPESYIKYGQYLLPLLKQCKVIFLIDGVDEMSDISNKLVTDILNEGKQCGNFTIVCTSRPEIVTEFRLKTPENYWICNVRLFGISPEERTDLVVKHYEWLAGGTSINTDSLRQVMEEIGRMELFRLPLNLLFLATVYYYKRESIATTLTQPLLYHLIHEWCIQKLLHRLHPPLTERKCLQKKVNTVLKVIYLVALQGLLQHRIYLTVEDEELISTSCSSQSLSRSEVMQAFYSVQPKVVYGVSKDRYCVPHKVFQDFFAARYINEQLDGYKEGAIRNILDRTMTGPEIRLEPLRYMFCHLLGLLNWGDSLVAMAMEETVDLIKESGMKYSRDWLSLLAVATLNPAVLQRVALHIKNRPDCKDEIEITDSTLLAAAALLPLIPSCSVIVTLERTSDTKDFRPILEDHRVVEMRLPHHFSHPGPAATSGRLLHRFPSNNLEKFRGHLDAEHLPLLPEGLKKLSLVVAGNDHARSLLPALSEAQKLLLRLSHLNIHIPLTSVTPDAITHPLPACPSVSLILSDVGKEKVESAWRVAAHLCPSEKKYKVIRFPGASLSMDDWQQIVEGLAGAGVRVQKGLRVPSSTVTEDDVRQLTSLTKSSLKAKESRRVPEFVLWL